MRIRLKGLHWTTAKLADGSTRTYFYAWKNGPRLRGEPGTPEFNHSYNEAIAKRVQAPEGTLQSLLDAYQQSQKFLALRERTRADYIIQIKTIEREFADFPLKALSARETRGVFLDWRDKLALRSRRQADYTWQVLALILAFAKDRGRITVNPCEKGGRLYNETRAEMVWSAEDESAFLERAPSYLHLPLLLALWTGQRRGDLLALPWSAYDGKTIRLRQSKTGTRVVIPVAAPLKAALDATPRQSPVVLVNSRQRPWNVNSFGTAWRRACALATIEGVTFHDLRGTAVTRLALAQCTEAEIVAITGHSLRDVRSILDHHYLARDPALAESAIRKLEENVTRLFTSK
jgi:integrase